MPGVVEPLGTAFEYIVLFSLALVLGGLVVCCLLACVLPDELAFMMGRKKTAPGGPPPNAAKAE
jgi:hypothetical protein